VGAKATLPIKSILSFLAEVGGRGRYARSLKVNAVMMIAEYWVQLTSHEQQGTCMLLLQRQFSSQLGAL
jgi:hypothetical protein